MGYDCISCTTDYGLQDGFVAACHGVIARITPTTRVIDITHSVAPQDIRGGAAVLAQTAPYLPNAVHLAVVDPGVGTARRGIVLLAERGTLVGPDNGLLLPAARALGGPRAAYQLENAEYQLPRVSATFHGRDVFAPAAAHLTRGVPAAEFGRPIELAELVELPEARVEVERDGLRSEVRTIDHFGNVQLAAPASALAECGLTPGTRVRIGTGTAAHECSVHHTFGDAVPGELLVLVDSAGYVALAVHGGSAADRLAARSVPMFSVTRVAR
ncbi:hypothetical protein EV191_103350 [Tamaricihabitans halophyticus]|uniref:SAM-dependent chlorinase/fluorinase n=1 Tax=Tamaricihabitans halophyticus TaxID=1262583 RepID=A0A4R2R4K6_9PSEU|nr:SAM-dependent chlorinase/fluorinase [Tamaricihabitans halophyticus]TCP54305.1 hypothetical protein EV191_103350 [Tamaricihabitans halophyticus]